MAGERVLSVMAGVMVMVVLVSKTTATQDTITLSANGAYSGVIVALRDDLDPSRCADYVQKIKVLIGNGSELLFNATNSKVFFGSVTIVVPETWTCDSVQINTSPLKLGWGDGHLRVGPQHLLFKDNPWTQQPRGCGQPGDFIYFSHNFILLGSSLGSPGNLLVHEWAKFRWGVFEEYGHHQDPVFPAAYRSTISTFNPTYCTNEKVNGSFGGQCTVNDKEENCSFQPDVTSNSNVNVTSSLLAAPFLDTVVKFCDATNHDSTAPTKHNLLCDKVSTSEIIKQHGDMTQISENTFMETNFTVVKASSGDTFVFVVDYSATMGQMKARWEFLRDSLCHFIEVFATSVTTVGLVVFNRDVRDYIDPMNLDFPGNRKTLADAIRNLGDPAYTKNITTGISKAAQMLPKEQGVIVLVTENLSEYPTDNTEIAAAQGHQVVPILYPNEPSISKQIYQELAAIVPGSSVLTVDNKLQTFDIGDETFQYQAVNNSESLMKNLLTVGGNSFVGIANETCTRESSCSMALLLTNNTQYESNVLIQVLYSTEAKEVAVKVTGPTSCANRQVDNTSWILECEQPQDGNYIVNVSRQYPLTDVKVSLLATPKTVNDSFDVLVWSSHGLSNLVFTKASVPKLFVMVSKMWCNVLFADVKAVITTADGANITLKLRDTGAGGDTTGNDGVYSAYMEWMNSPGDVGITVTATDNSGAARILRVATSSAPVIDDQACCGSRLIIPSDLLEDPGAFVVSSPGLTGRIKGIQPDPLPPARITDLSSSQDGMKVKLSFTAPGDQLDQGTAASYTIQYQVFEDNSQMFTENMTGVTAGSLVEHFITPPSCETLYTFTVTATSSQGKLSSVSNEVRNLGSCSKTKLTSGAIAGIVIGSLLGVIIIIILVYLCLNRDHLEDLWLWQVLTCRCLRKKKDDNTVYNSPPPRSARRNDVIRTNTTSVSRPVRDIGDLYTKPNLEAKRETLKKKQEEEDDGGFGDHRRRRENIQMSAVSDNSSQRSSPYPYNVSSTLPINQVGLPQAVDPHNHRYPIEMKAQHLHERSLRNTPTEHNSSYDGSHDNFAYDGYSGMDHYGNRDQLPRNPRVNTQV